MITARFPEPYDYYAKSVLIVLLQRIQDDFMEVRQAGEDVFSEVYSDDTTAARRECTEVAECLRLFENAESVRFTGNGEIDLIVVDDLEEDAGVWTTFVKLSGRVKKARTITGRCRALCTIAHDSSEILKLAIEVG